MNAVLDVGAGLVLMYLTLSLLCTTLNEMIAGFFQLRAKTLKNALDKLIDDPNLKALFYNHGLIDGARVAASGGAASTTPAPAAPETTPAAAPKPGWIARIRGAVDHPSYLASRDVAMALIGSLGTTTDAIPSLADVTASVKAMKDGNLRDALLGCLAQAEGSIDKMRDRTALWFDAAMDRLSGAYRRDVRNISFVVGLLVAVAFNADTFNVALALWQNPTLAGELAQSANATAAAHDVNSIPLTPNPACTEPAKDAADMQQQVYRLCLLNAQAMPFPLGWAAMPAGWAWFWKVIGLLATAIALTMGAPFWFDVLNKFVNVRASGVKPKPEQPTAT